MTNILPLQQNQPLVDTKTGYFTAFFKRYMDQILARLGGITGGIYGQLKVVSGSIFWDLNINPNAELTLANGVNIINPPVNLVAGLNYTLVLVQPSTGAAGTVSWPDPPIRFPGGITPALSSANGAIDVLGFFCDGSNVYLTIEALNQS